MTSGMLTLKIIQGRLTRDVETFGKQDPYIKFVYMGEKRKTRVHEGGGKEPVWNEEFVIPLGSTTDDIKFEVKD